MGRKRTLVVCLDEDILLKAHMLAMTRGGSIGEVVADAIRELAGATYTAAMAIALADLDAGLDLGGPPYAPRDDTHER